MKYRKKSHSGRSLQTTPLAETNRKFHTNANNVITPAFLAPNDNKDLTNSKEQSTSSKSGTEIGLQAQVQAIKHEGVKKQLAGKHKLEEKGQSDSERICISRTLQERGGAPSNSVTPTSSGRLYTSRKRARPSNNITTVAATKSRIEMNPIVSLQSKETPTCTNLLSPNQNLRPLSESSISNPYLKKIPFPKLENTSPPGGLKTSNCGEDVDISLIPGTFDSFDRFFGILLRSTSKDYVNSHGDDNASLEVWKTLCDRVKLPILHRKIQPVYNDPKAHFIARASLILEEARETLSRPLAERRNRRRNRKSAIRSSEYTVFTDGSKANSVSIRVDLVDVLEKDHGVTKLTFKGDPEIISKQECVFRLGFIFECIHGVSLGATKDEDAMLGCIIPGDGESMYQRGTFDVAFFLPNRNITRHSTWTLIPVDNFLPLWRQFSAVMLEKPEELSLITALQGLPNESTSEKSVCDNQTIVLSSQASTPPKPHPIKSRTQAEGAVNGNEVLELCRNGAYSTCRRTKRQLPFKGVSGMGQPATNLNFEQLGKLTFQLNETQKRAVGSFLESPEGSITIVQGPPGTGKTTLLVATICRFFLQNEDSPVRRGSRLLVCAPTNKAILVLAHRFLKQAGNCGINTVIIGESKKLLGTNQKSNPLRPFFAYTWHEVVCERLLKLIKKCDPHFSTECNVTETNFYSELVQLMDFLERNLQELPQDFKANLQALQKLAASDDIANDSSMFKLLRKIHDIFAAFPKDVILNDLLNSAHVIFSTLSSSGCTAMKRTKCVQALIVDEAAAATEPDIYIPFHLNPNRLLIVGDPKQLPATVQSERAKQLGLDISLHERLMYDCEKPYTMLDLQYRMNPEISSFPSRHFYSHQLFDAQEVRDDRKYNRLLDGSPYLFLKTSGIEFQTPGGSSRNKIEAKAVVELVGKLRESGISDWNSPERVRIITFYQAQMNLIRTMLLDHGMMDVLVSTVDSSQGCEADVVILSLVRTKRAGFLSDNRRLNVALTRARHQLVCVGSVGNFRLMKNAPSLLELEFDAEQRQVVTKH